MYIIRVNVQTHGMAAIPKSELNHLRHDSLFVIKVHKRQTEPQIFDTVYMWVGVFFLLNKFATSLLTLLAWG